MSVINISPGDPEWSAMSKIKQLAATPYRVTYVQIPDTKQEHRHYTCNEQQLKSMRKKNWLYKIITVVARREEYCGH